MLDLSLIIYKVNPKLPEVLCGDRHNIVEELEDDPTHARARDRDVEKATRPFFAPHSI